MGSKKINPPRRRTKEQARADNRKQLAARESSSTVETKTPIIEEINGTDKIPPIEKTVMVPIKEPAVAGLKLSKTLHILEIIGGIIAFVIFVGMIVYHYTSLKEGLNHTNSNLTELKQTINERIYRLEERIDKYISKEKSK